MRVDAESAFVLHTRPYRESSLLVDLFTSRYGRIKAVARGTRSQKKSVKLSPFSPLQVCWSGKSDLKTLMQCESDGIPAILQGERLFTGLYLNELLMRLLPEQDAVPDLYNLYSGVLYQLSTEADLEPLLRRFEFCVLEALGYGLELAVDMADGEPVTADREYLFTAEGGLSGQYDARAVDLRALFQGRQLLAIAAEDYREADVRQSAKRLARLALQPHIGNTPLRSRELFMANRRRD